MNQESPVSAKQHLPSLIASAHLPPLDPAKIEKFDEYLSLLLRWNERTNLTAIRDPLTILERHFVECIACAQLLPAEISTLLDFGSGAGLPGIPIAVCRPEITVTLAESQGKKAAFLREAVRGLKLDARVHGDRVESLKDEFDCVTLRAVDQMEKSIRLAPKFICAGGWLVAMTTNSDLPFIQAASEGLSWSPPFPLPGANDRIVALGEKP